MSMGQGGGGAQPAGGNGGGPLAAGALALLDEALRWRLVVEEFLYREALLLDAWRLEEWLALFTPDARYVVPTTDLPQGDPDTDHVFVDDGYRRLQGRVTRLLSRHAHREYPSSRTRRLITNVLVTAVRDDAIEATASFAVYRFRAGQGATYVGRYDYVLARTPDGLRIRYRRATLDQETLRDHGAVSIIL
ncbi:MAG TPA: aromatic-ring-hydroxylating dioxygenase subunit beta [Chloroflexota bacterium]|jgi:p-cumate 2,3-dioxygenase beta subunit